MEVSLKKSNLNTHISSDKHKTNKEKIAKISMNEKDVAEALTKFDDKHHPKTKHCQHPRGFLG